jgi:hypothetical protein
MVRTDEIPEVLPPAAGIEMLAERTRVRTAALHAKRRYPGPVGQLVSDELLAWAEFGYVFGPGRARELVDFLMHPDNN